ncbi:MAG: zinc metalloprotease HtpX [Smithellaceae bacterium]|nr:zinc metalloprotease HtpX [Smithellaceae bacterium]
MNSLKTALLLGALTGLLMFIGGLFGGNQGVLLAFIFAAILNMGAYWYSDKLILRMYKAREVSETHEPVLYNLVRNLSMKAGLPLPKVYIIPQDAPNAFATGRNEDHAVVAVTEGLLRILTREELEGVIAHELAHIKNRDMLIGSIAATMAGAIAMLANMAQWAAIFGGGNRDSEKEGAGGMIGLILMAILAPLAASLIQMSISRSREYLADASGARFSGNPQGLAAALEKITLASQMTQLEANPSTAHMFIVNPLFGQSFKNLFSTHPPVAERIERLRQMKIY